MNRIRQVTVQAIFIIAGLALMSQLACAQFCCGTMCVELRDETGERVILAPQSKYLVIAEYCKGEMDTIYAQDGVCNTFRFRASCDLTLWIYKGVESMQIQIKGISQNDGYYVLTDLYFKPGSFSISEKEMELWRQSNYTLKTLTSCTEGRAPIPAQLLRPPE